MKPPPASSQEQRRAACADTLSPPAGEPGAGTRLRLLSYNIQAGISSARYRHYLTHAWKHVLPYADRRANLDRIAGGLGDYDVVGLQEVDAGSLRTGFINQTEYLAWRAGFPYWYHQTNRRVGKVTGHSNGLLSRLVPREIVDYKLPGLRGRGVLLVSFGQGAATLSVFIMHLALGKRARLRQMAFLGELLADHPCAVVMGDLNCRPRSLEMRRLRRRSGLRPVADDLPTFPSWRPRWNIDHILVTPDIEVQRSFIPGWLYSDHLPIATEVVIPEAVATGPG